MMDNLANTKGPTAPTCIADDPCLGAIDGQSTNIVNERVARILVWKDEFGYVRQMVGVASCITS